MGGGTGFPLLADEICELHGKFLRVGDDEDPNLFRRGYSWF